MQNYMRDRQIPFWINRTVHTKDNSPGMHVHDFVELVFIVSGKAVHKFEDDRYEIYGGDVYIINPGEAHTYEVAPNDSLEIINCLFVPEIVHHSCLLELGINDSMDYYYVHPFLGKRERFHHRLNLTGESASRVLHLMDDMIKEFERHECGFSAMIRIQLVELLLLLSRFYAKKTNAPAKKNEKKLLVQRICGYLERNYEKKLTITMLSELFNLSPRQLNRVFKEETGKTIFEMIHSIRVEKAKHLLSESDEKVITIAANIGYEDPAFFNRLFQRIVGCPPSKYRKQSQKQLSNL